MKAMSLVVEFSGVAASSVFWLGLSAKSHILLPVCSLYPSRMAAIGVKYSDCVIFKDHVAIGVAEFPISQKRVR